MQSNYGDDTKNYIINTHVKVLEKNIHRRKKDKVENEKILSQLNKNKVTSKNKYIK
jgi:hypothetical protein